MQFSEILQLKSFRNHFQGKLRSLIR